MAKKNNFTTSDFITLVVILLLFIISYITPAVIVIFYMYNKLKERKIRKNISGTKSDFWLNDDEKNNFKIKLEELSRANLIIEQANNHGDMSGVSRNKDGTFSARSKLGKKLKLIIREYEPIKDNLTLELHELQSIPTERWNEFNNYLRNTKACMWSFLSWLVTMFFYPLLPVAAFVAILIYFVFRAIYSQTAEKCTPKPEPVTLENIDKY